jgi:phage-related protein
LWIGSSRDDMRELPVTIRRAFGLSLYAVQCGETPSSSKSLKGFSGVFELRENNRDGTFRTVYATKLANAVYVLHVFQKKSKLGISTPRPDMNVIRLRLKLAEADASRRKESK